MTYPTIKGAWTPLHDALYYPLSQYLSQRRLGVTLRTSTCRRRALALIAQIKGRA